MRCAGLPALKLRRLVRRMDEAQQMDADLVEKMFCAGADGD